MANLLDFLDQVNGVVKTSATLSLSGGIQVSPLPLAVSGTVSVNPHDVRQTAGPWAVSGTVTINTPGTLGVSGSVTVGNSPNVGQTAGPWAVSGTVSVNPHDVRQTGGPWAVSGTVTVGNSPNVGQTAGPWAVSGTVTVGNTPNVNQTGGPWAVSGTVVVQGMAASGAVFSGNPQVIAGLYVSGGVGQVLVIPLLVDALGRLVVQGGSPAGMPVSGNPVLVAGSDGVNARTILTDSTGRPVIGNIVQAGGVSWTGFNSASDSMGNGGGGVVVYPYTLDFDGGAWNRHRNNVDVTSLSQAIRASGSITSADITTYNARGIVVFLDIKTASGAFQQFQLTINSKDPASSNYIPLLSGGIVASGGIQPSPTTMAYKIYPGISGNFSTPTGVSLQSVVSDHVPRVLQLVLSPVAGINYYWVGSLGYTLLY